MSITRAIFLLKTLCNEITKQIFKDFMSKTEIKTKIDSNIAQC